MAQALGSVAVGSIVKLNENGSPVEFYVAKHDYESGLNGAGRTLVVRKDCYDERVWNSTNVNAYATSDIDAWFNGTYKNLIASDIRATIGTTKFRYTPGNGNSTVTTLERAVFSLSVTELGKRNSKANVEGTTLPIAKKLNQVNQWTRTPDNSSAGDAFIISYGNAIEDFCYRNNDSRPCFTLPETLTVKDDGTISTSPINPSTLTVPQMVMQGNQISVSWSAVDGADGYILERKANTDADWTQVYSGANTSFEETVGTWTSVQYRVKAGISGTYGDYTTSASVPVVSASAVVISGTDGDLGTLVNDVSYTVSSDGSTELTVVETINGTETRTYTATNGATNKIPVVDLPTGYGTIKITASTNPGSGVVTVTREWTYTKAAITFPDAGSVADLTQQGKTIWAKTIAEAVRTPGIWDGNLGLALAKLAGAVLYNRNRVAKYTEVKVNLATAQEGNIISLPENGKMVEFYVAKLDYESALNGAGRVLVARKDGYGSSAWNSELSNAYSGSDIDDFLNSTYKNALGADVLESINTTKFYYTPGNGDESVGVLERAVFLLSGTEVGCSDTLSNVEGTVLPVASEFQGSALDQWTRSPILSSTYSVLYLFNGSFGNGSVTTPRYFSPCFTLPSTFTATYYVGSDGTVHDEQEYEEAGTFTDISGGAIPMVQIETGSYVGTGTYGQASPNKLTFNFEPQLVFIFMGSNTVNNAFGFFVRDCQWAPTKWDLAVRHPGGCNVIWGSNYIEYYSTEGVDPQLNNSIVPYNYVVIGTPIPSGVFLETPFFSESSDIVWNFSIPSGIKVPESGAVDVTVTMTRAGDVQTWSSGRYVTYSVEGADGSGTTTDPLSRASADAPAPTFTIPITNATSKTVSIRITGVSTTQG